MPVPLVVEGTCTVCGCEVGSQDADCAGCDFGCHEARPQQPTPSGLIRLALSRGMELFLVVACSYMALHVAWWAVRGFPVAP